MLFEHTSILIEDRFTFNSKKSSCSKSFLCEMYIPFFSFDGRLNFFEDASYLVTNMPLKNQEKKIRYFAPSGWYVRVNRTNVTLFWLESKWFPILFDVISPGKSSMRKISTSLSFVFHATFIGRHFQLLKASRRAIYFRTS